MKERFDERTLGAIKRCYEMGDYDNCLSLFCSHDQLRNIKITNYRRMIKMKKQEIFDFCQRSRPDIAYSNNSREKLDEFIASPERSGEPYWIANSRIIIRDLTRKLAEGKIIKIQDKEQSVHFTSKKSAVRHLLQRCTKEKTTPAREFYN